MENSFYYFFSATPQVLAGILALFGVFVIFKMQAIKMELLSFGRSILEEARAKWNGDPNEKIASTRLGDTSLILEIDNAIQRQDISKIYRLIEGIDHRDLKYSITLYSEIYKFLQTLLKRTFYLSLFTAMVIILCLSIIPFGKYLLCHLEVLYVTFGIIIVSIIISFSGLIYILRDSLNDTLTSLLPRY
jgi:hypothetical protein